MMKYLTKKCVDNKINDVDSVTKSISMKSKIIKTNNLKCVIEMTDIDDEFI